MKEFEQIPVALAIAYRKAAAATTKKPKDQLRILLNTVTSSRSEIACKTEMYFSGID